jgi:hypothetical protein
MYNGHKVTVVVDVSKRSACVNLIETKPDPKDIEPIKKDLNQKEENIL